MVSTAVDTPSAKITSILTPPSLQSLLRHQTSQDVSLCLRASKLDAQIVSLLLHGSQGLLKFFQPILTALTITSGGLGITFTLAFA